MKGYIIGFQPKDTGCDPQKLRHAFRGMDCNCGRIRLRDQLVGPDLSVKAEEVKR